MSQDNRQKNTPVHCPKCTNVLVASVEVVGGASFRIKCQHCKTLLSVRVRQEPVVEVREAVQVTFIGSDNGPTGE